MKQIFLLTLALLPVFRAQSQNWPTETLRSGIIGAWSRPADFDQDGAPDILVQNGDTIFWYENLRPGWTPHIIDAAFINSVVGYVDVLDMDKDGDMDVLKVNGVGDGHDEMSWNENQSNGTVWVKHHIINPSFLNIWPEKSYGDLDGDGDLDLLLGEANFNDPTLGSLYWLEHTNDPDVWTKHLLIDSGLFFFTSVADMDSDGDQDLVYSSEGIHWLENQLPLTTWPHHSVVTSSLFQYTIGNCVDLTGDGKPDILAGQNSSNAAAAYFVQPDWNEVIAMPDTLFYYISSYGDVDGDGDTDVLYGGVGGPIQPLGWSENQNNGLNWVRHDISTPDDLQKIPTGLADIDGDGDMDIVSLTFNFNSGLGSVFWAANPKISSGVNSPSSPNLQMVVHPNPANAYLDVLIHEPEKGPFQVELLDLNGRLVQTAELSGAYLKLDVSAAPPGCYVLKVFNEKYWGAETVIKK